MIRAKVLEIYGNIKRHIHIHVYISGGNLWKMKNVQKQLTKHKVYSELLCNISTFLLLCELKLQTCWFCLGQKWHKFKMEGKELLALDHSISGATEVEIPWSCRKLYATYVNIMLGERLLCFKVEKLLYSPCLWLATCK